MQYWLINERGNGDSGGEAAYFAEGALANGAMEVEVKEVDLAVKVYGGRAATAHMAP